MSKFNALGIIGLQDEKAWKVFNGICTSFLLLNIHSSSEWDRFSGTSGVRCDAFLILEYPRFSESFDLVAKDCWATTCLGQGELDDLEAARIKLQSSLALVDSKEVDKSRL